MVQNFLLISNEMIVKQSAAVLSLLIVIAQQRNLLSRSVSRQLTLISLGSWVGEGGGVLTSRPFNSVLFSAVVTKARF